MAFDPNLQSVAHAIAMPGEQDECRVPIQVGDTVEI